MKSTTFHKVSEKERIAEVPCAFPPCQERMSGSIVQRKHGEDWTPALEDALPNALAASGWVQVDGRTYCGQHHARLDAHALQREKPIKPVERIPDATYQSNRQRLIAQSAREERRPR